MKFKLIGVAMILLCTMQKATTQETSELLTNKLVLDIYKAGLGKETIVSKIENSTCKFDVSTTGLILLKKQGLPNEIINAMVNKGNNKKITSLTNSSQTTQSSAKKLNIELLNYVHTYYNDTIVPLEKVLASVKTKMKAFGYGGTNVVLEIEGETSPVMLKSDNTSAFVIKTGSETAPDIVLYKLKKSGKKRQAVTTKFTLGGMQGSEGAATVNFSKLDNGIFKILISNH